MVMELNEAPKKPSAIEAAGQTLRLVLLRAIVEKRIIVGLPAATKALADAPEEILFCVVAESSAQHQETAAAHMNRTLLEAFCYENDIYVVKVDSADRLNRILGTNLSTSFALVQKTMRKLGKSMVGDEELLLTDAELAMVDHCEDFWDMPQTVLKLSV